MEVEFKVHSCVNTAVKLRKRSKSGNLFVASFTFNLSVASFKGCVFFSLDPAFSEALTYWLVSCFSPPSVSCWRGDRLPGMLGHCRCY
jgi:hypothetical protein